MRTDTPKDVPTHLLQDPDAFITRMGKFLRKTSLDELPQILHNVLLKGDMTIIGPRPALWNQYDLIEERDKYGANDVKPGISGWAQIHGRDELEIPVKAKLDGYYAQNISFWLDVKCVLGTVSSVLKSEGVVEGGTGAMEAAASKERPKILICTNHSYMLYQFRRELIQKLMETHEVVISMPYVGHEEDFQEMGCKCIETPIDRRGINPVTDLKLIKAYAKMLKEEKPDIVIGTGGFICGPVLLSASKQKIPTMLHESNAFPGVTVKLLAKKVDTILIGFEDAREKIHDAKNIVLTGTPTKFKEVEYNENEKDEFLKENKLNKNQTLILVFGGSQGARPINNALEEIIEKKLNTNYQILWTVGKSQYDIIKENLAKKDIDIEKIENVKVVPYIYDMQKAMSVADLIVCRSGAMTITEVSISGRPAIFVPLSFAAENHQEYNAKVLVKENAAKIIHDNEINGEALNNLINETIKDKEKLKEMGNNARKIVMKDVENKIYNEVKRLVNKG